MKRLLIALAAAVAMLTASARVTDTQSFETSFSDFEPSVAAEDESALVDYDNDGPDFAAPYNFADFGSKYLSLDTGDATLWRTNTGNAAYLDMVMQFNPCTETPTVDSDTKISVYLNASSNLVVLAGPAVNDEPTVYETNGKLNPGDWGRVTISAVEGGFKIRLNGTELESLDETPVSTFPSLTGDSAILEVGFSGSGKLDDFVARTTDPFLQNPAATIGGEGYASFADALADDPTATPQLEADASYTIASRGGSVGVKLNNHTLTVTAPEGLYAYPTTSGDVTTYTADYFPRTATAGQDGTAANPYEIADVDDIAALKAAFAADATFRSKNYKLVADIDATDLGYWDGIGTANGTIAKTNGDGLNGGTFDGAGHTISNVKFTNTKYRGFFNSVTNSTIKNLTINVVDIQQTSAAEHGYAAFAGNMKDSKIQNCVATGTIGTTAKPAMHTCGGFVVKSSGGNVFENCTNYVDIVCSLNDNPKIGGIVGLVQEGSAAFTNCWNYGDMTITCKKCADTGNGAGGLIGYGTTAITIYGGGNAGTIQSTNTTADGADKNSISYDIKIGTIIAMQNSSTATVTGGVVAQADAAPAGAFANISGLTYATVDNNVATFVPDAELAAGNTYVLQQNVAASETPVFTLAEASDTIAFDTAKGVTFEGTVAVDRSKLMPATSETVGTVTTYSATAGVASVDGTAYATFADALAALEGETTDDFVTLLANVAYAVYAGDSFKVNLNGHSFASTKAKDDVVYSERVDGNDILIITAVEGVASCNGTWYASFDAAYGAALAASGNATMVVRITEDFTPAISATYNHFYSLTFEDVRDDKSEGLTINLKNSAGTAFMKSSRYFFPNNAKLVLAADWEPWQTGLATGGTLEIPEGVTVSNLGSWEALNGLSAVVGAGTVAPSAAVCYYLFSHPDAVLPTSMRAATWTGTLVVTGAVEGTGAAFDYVWNLGNYGNSGSTIRFNGVTTYLYSGEHPVNVDIVGEGLTINGNYGSGTWTFSGDLTGTGPLNVAIENSSGGSTLKAVKFTGDASEFAGSIDFGENANAYVQFGSEGVASTDLAAKRIITGDDAEVTVASGKTWKSSNFMLHGNVTLNGNLRNIDDTEAGVVWNNHSSAVFTVNAAGLFKFGNYTSWTGTYVVNHSLASAATAFIIPTAENATTVINGDENGEFVGFPATGNDPNGPPTVKGKIVLNADWTTGDGWSTEANATTFASLSGSGDLTVNDKNNYYYQLWYKITELDGYTGTLGGRNGKFVIGKVNVAEMPADGARVVKTACGTYGEIAGDLKLFVDGVDTGKTLTYVADGAQGAGLYYVVPKDYVAQIGETKYETLAEAVAAAQAGDTITLLGNLELGARVEPNKTMTFDLGGYTLSRTGTGGNGSVIDVKGGDVTITNGVIDCTQDDTAIVADGVYALTVRSGATLTLDDLTVTVDSQAGACVYPFAGATVTILGGTYGNNTADAYQYHADWTGMAVNQANVSQQLITIRGGRFYKVNPALGDDSWASAGNGFLAEGYEAKQDGDYWVVSEKSGEELEPGQSSKSYETEEAATAAVAGVEITVPAAVAGELDSAAQETYKTMFEKKVVSDGAGGYKVEVALTAAAETALADDATTNVMATVAASLPDIIADAAAEQTEVTVSNVVPGFYYSISYGTALDAMNTEGTRVLAPASGTITLQTPAKAANATAGFYKVLVNITDK